jgi:hypothetical protein
MRCASLKQGYLIKFGHLFHSIPVNALIDTGEAVRGGAGLRRRLEPTIMKSTEPGIYRDFSEAAITSILALAISEPVNLQGDARPVRVSMIGSQIGQRGSYSQHRERRQQALLFHLHRIHRLPPGQRLASAAGGLSLSRAPGDASSRH